MRLTTDYILNNFTLEGTTDGLYITNGDFNITLKYDLDEIKEYFNVTSDLDEFININIDEIDEYLINKNIELINKEYNKGE